MVEKHCTKLIFWLKFEYQDPERPWFRNILNSFKWTVVVPVCFNLFVKMWKGIFAIQHGHPQIKGKGWSSWHFWSALCPRNLWPHPLQEDKVFCSWDVSAYLQPWGKSGRSPEIIFMSVPSAYWVFKKSKFVCGLVQNAGATVTVWFWRWVWFLICTIDLIVLALQDCIQIELRNLCKSC